MSVKLMAKIWDDGPEGQGERFVLLALADYANDAGECWPALASVARKCCLTDRGVRKILRRLEDDGWLETEVGGGRHGCSKYTINPERGSPRNVVPPGTRVQETRNQSAENPERGSAEPSRTIKEPSKKDAREVLPILSEVLSEGVARDFIVHRKALKKPLTARAAELVAGKLRGCRDPDAVANASIMNGWQGVFPEREQAGARPGPAGGGYDAQADRWAYIAKHGTSEGWRRQA